MSKQKVVSNKYLPARSPLVLGGVYYLLSDKFHFYQWVDGVIYFLILVLFISYVFYTFWGQDFSNPFKKELKDE